MNKEELEKIHNNIEARIIDERNIGYLRNKYSPHLMDTINLYNEVVDLQLQLEEKDKIIEEKNKCLLEIAKEEINFIKYLKSKGMNFDNESWINELEEILERGKNE